MKGDRILKKLTITLPGSARLLDSCWIHVIAYLRVLFDQILCYKAQLFSEMSEIF